MARRYNYKWNTQNITCGKLSTLNVLNKIEVVPGDTLSGKMGIITKFENFKKGRHPYFGIGDPQKNIKKYIKRDI